MQNQVLFFVLLLAFFLLAQGNEVPGMFIVFRTQLGGRKGRMMKNQSFYCLFMYFLLASELQRALLNNSLGFLQAHSWGATLQGSLRLRISQLTTALLDTKVVGDW